MTDIVQPEMVRKLLRVWTEPLHENLAGANLCRDYLTLWERVENAEAAIRYAAKHYLSVSAAAEVYSFYDPDTKRSE